MEHTPARTGGIEPTEIHDILRNDRRRKVIKHLQSRTGPVELRTLSERIAELESGESPPPRDLRQSVYNSLYQTHLPKLDERGVVDYDGDRKTVELLEGARQVDVYMEVVTEYGVSWATYYRTLGVTALLAVVTAEAGVPPMTAVPTLWWGLLFLAVFVVSTGYRLWTRRWFYLRSLLE